MTDTESDPDGDTAVRNPREKAANLVRELLIERPLYAKVEGDEALMEAVDEIIKAKITLDFDLYCMTCRQVTPWTIKPSQSQNSGGGAGLRYPVHQYVPPVRVVNAVCLRRQHFYTYVLFRRDGVVQKIGQKPSMADIAYGELKGIPGIEARDRKELGRALGLFAHDTPLGAFVYLRRVFERMIERAHDRYKEINGAYVEDWLGMRMGERVKALGAALPHEISDNVAVFGLLSKGIHALSDEDAEALFPLVKAVIFQMLGDEERHRHAIAARQETERALQAAVARYRAPDA